MSTKKCVVGKVVYKTTVTASNDTKTYIRSTEGDFITRYPSHTHSFKKVYKRHTTALADFIWRQKLKDTDKDNL